MVASRSATCWVRRPTAATFTWRWIVPLRASLNEAVLTVDLSTTPDATLTFAHKDVGDEDTPLPPIVCRRRSGRWRFELALMAVTGTRWSA